MKVLRFASATVVVLLITSGCASIVSHTQWPVTINSNPTGAMVTVKNKRGVEMQKGTTPMTLTLSSKSGYFSPAEYQFTFEKDGYLPATTSLSAGLNGWYIGNIVFGGLIGLVIVDPATGAMWRLNDMVYGNLSPDPNRSKELSGKGGGAVLPPSKVTETSEDIRARLKYLEDLKKQGVLTEKEYQAKRKALIDKL